jgi:hypothetical protein
MLATEDAAKIFTASCSIHAAIGAVAYPGDG